MPEQRYKAEDLIEFATALLDKAGMEHDKSRTVAEVLVEGDLLGHSTHGLQLLPPYLGDIGKGELKPSGQPKVVADRPAVVVWDGDRLPGPWLVTKAIELACERAQTQGTCTVTIRRGHHIACLAAYLKRATDRGMMVMLLSSAPSASSAVGACIQIVMIWRTVCPEASLSNPSLICSSLMWSLISLFTGSMPRRYRSM